MENLAATNGDGFIFVSSESWSAKKPKPHGGKPITKAEREERNKEVEARDLQTKIKSTMSSIKSKDVKDPRKYYVIIKHDEKATKTELYDALLSLKATVHAYLNEQHTLILISVDVVTLINYTKSKSGFPLNIQRPLLDFRELKREEQLGRGIIQDKSWHEEAKLVILHLIPNIGKDRAQDYLGTIQEYFKKRNLPILWKASPEQGMLITKMNRETAEDLLNHSNFVFNIHGIPKGIATKSVAATEAPRKIKAKLSSYSVNLSLSTNKLPVVCVVDSGLNPIPSLMSLIQNRDAYQSFSNPDDEAEYPEGHGTPIACLAARGEGNGLARARIVSYKIYSQDNGDVRMSLGHGSLCGHANSSQA